MSNQPSSPDRSPKGDVYQSSLSSKQSRSSKQLTRNTKQRAAISTALTRTGEFLTAQQIHSEVTVAGHRVGLATVYRTLAAMVEVGEIDGRRNNSGEMSYRLCVTEYHHHHLLCRNCGKTVELVSPEIEQWARQVSRENGFSSLDHEIELVGLCSECAASVIEQ